MAGAVRTLVWKGSKKLEHQPDSPEYRASKDGPSWTYNYAGPYAVVLAAKPERLATFSGIPDGFAIDTVRISKAPGGRGLLTFTVTQAPVEDVSLGTVSQPIDEIEWTEVEKKLETHKRYTDGPHALTTSDLIDIEAWKDEKDVALRKGFQYKPDSGATQTLSANAQAFATKLLRGTDSYVVFVPVARVTTKHATKPQTYGCGYREAPPSVVKVNGYDYLRTADRLVRQDREWQRVQEWSGTDAWDPEIYHE